MDQAREVVTLQCGQILSHSPPLHAATLQLPKQGWRCTKTSGTHRSTKDERSTRKPSRGAEILQKSSKLLDSCKHRKRARMCRDGRRLGTGIRTSSIKHGRFMSKPIAEQRIARQRERMGTELKDGKAMSHVAKSQASLFLRSFVQVLLVVAAQRHFHRRVHGA